MLRFDDVSAMRRDRSIIRKAVTLWVIQGWATLALPPLRLVVGILRPRMIRGCRHLCGRAWRAASALVHAARRPRARSGKAPVNVCIRSSTFASSSAVFHFLHSKSHIQQFNQQPCLSKKTSLGDESGDLLGFQQFDMQITHLPTVCVSKQQFEGEKKHEYDMSVSPGNRSPWDTVGEGLDLQHMTWRMVTRRTHPSSLCFPRHIIPHWYETKRPVSPKQAREI